MKYASSILVTAFCVAYVLGVVVTLNHVFPPPEKTVAAASAVP